MTMTVREVMDARFYTLSPGISVAQALKIFKQASEEQKQTVFGMAVVDAHGRLVGMLSMYDFFLLLRPKHIHIWGEMKDIDVSGIIEAAYQRASSMLVGDIMTTEVITTTPDTHLLQILDIMIKKHVRRLPVLEHGKMVGMVYISRVFHYLLDRFAR